MADLTTMIAARLARLYAGAATGSTPAIWNPADLPRPGRPATTFAGLNPDHAFARFVVEFGAEYADAARGRRVAKTEGTADLPFIGSKVLAGEAPVIVLSQRSYSPLPGSVSLWAMLFPFGPSAPREYATTPEWTRWASKYPAYQQVLCGTTTGASFGLDAESMVVTDACLPPGCGAERRFFSDFVNVLPRPRMILCLGADAAKRLGVEQSWAKLRALQSDRKVIDARAATSLSPAGVPVVVAPFAWGNNAKDRGGLHFTGAVEATRTLLA